MNTPTNSEALPLTNCSRSYRLLDNGETIENTDEVLDSDTVTWKPLPLTQSKFVGKKWEGRAGCKWNGNSYMPMRRQISSENSVIRSQVDLSNFTI